MFRKLLLVLMLVAALVAAHASLAAENPPPRDASIPSDAMAVLELSQPNGVLDLLLDERVVAAVKASPVYTAQVAQPGMQQFFGAVKYVEGQLGTDWATAIRKLLGGGVSVAVMPDGGRLLIVDSLDATMLNKFNEIMIALVRMDAMGKGKPDPVASKEFKGGTYWTLGDGQAYAIVGNRLVFSNYEATLKTALDFRGNSLASLPAYRSARAALGDDGTATLLTDLGRVKQNPNIQGVLAGSQQPIGALLFATVTDALRDSKWLALKLRVGKESVALDVTTDGKAGGSELTAFTWPAKADAGALPNLAVPRQIAGLSLYRDLQSFYSAKDKLFPERTSGLIFFENMMGIFFSGRNLTDDVLAELKPEIRFVVAEQAYDAKIGKPLVQLPAFAVIFGVRHPEEFAPVAEEAWQKAVGLVAITSGQKGQSGMIIDRDTYKDIRYSVAYFGKPRGEDKTWLPMQYNFRPSLVLCGNQMILSSTDALAKDLIDALQKEAAAPAKPLAETNTLLELNGPQLSSIVSANRLQLVRNNMVEKGNSRDQAEGEINVLLGVLQYLGPAKLSLGARDGKPHAGLEIKFVWKE